MDFEWISRVCVLQGDSVTFTDELGSTAPAVSPAGSVDQLLGVVRLLLSEGLVSRVGACFHFQISSSDGECKSYYVDLSQGGWSLFVRGPDPNVHSLPVSKKKNQGT